MEFGGAQGVTLVHVAPLDISDRYSQCYGLQGYGHPVANLAAGGDQPAPVFGNMHANYDSMAGPMEVSTTPSPNPPPAPTTMHQQQLSPYYCPEYSMEHNCQSPYDFIPQNPPYSADYIHSPRVGHPAVSVCDSQSVDLNGLDMLLKEADLGPQPVRAPRIDRDTPPRTKEPAYSPTLIPPIQLPKATRRHRPTSSLKSTIRQSPPIFPPGSSTPLSSVSLSRHESLTSICSSTKSDAYSIVAPSVRSDPGPYRLQQSNGIDSAIDSPTVMSAQGSPRFEYSSTTSSTQSLPVPAESSSRSCMEVAMPMKLARKITDLDKKILKLQADRSKLLEKAHQNKSSSSFDGVSDDMNIDTRMLMEKSSEVGRVHLYIVPLGVHVLDEPLYEDANAILRQVGGLYFDYQSAVDNLRSICCKGMVRLPDISTCFAYIKSLLSENQKLKLENSATGYRIQLDLDSAVPNQEVPTEFVKSLGVANEVMRCAQQITKAYTTLQMQLQQVRQTAAAKSDQCDSICQSLGIIDRERRTQIKSVLEGNCTIMSTVERVWPQYYQVAMETIKTITECIHPQA